MQFDELILKCVWNAVGKNSKDLLEGEQGRGMLLVSRLVTRSVCYIGGGISVGRWDTVKCSA